MKIRTEFNIPTLKTKRKLASYLFIYRLINNKIDCADLLSQISFKVKKCNTRNSPTFYIPPTRVKRTSSPLLRCCAALNSVEIDIFAATLSSFLNILKSKILEF